MTVEIKGGDNDYALDIVAQTTVGRNVDVHQCTVGDVDADAVAKQRKMWLGCRTVWIDILKNKPYIHQMFFEIHFLEVVNMK